MDSDCSCSIDGFADFDGYSEFHTEKRPVARKEYECYECRETISPGQKYEYVSGKFDGEFFVTKTCLTCCSIRAVFFCSWIIGEIMNFLHEELRENNGEVSSECILALTPKARERVFEMIEKVWEETDN